VTNVNIFTLTLMNIWKLIRWTCICSGYVNSLTEPLIKKAISNLFVV